MPRNILNLALRIILSILIFIIVMFSVAWLLEDAIYFSLFVGIPAGIVSAAVAFVVLTRYQNKKRQPPAVVFAFALVYCTGSRYTKRSGWRVRRAKIQKVFCS